MKFQVEVSDSSARIGQLETAHGTIETPVFMPVGTVGVVRSLTPADVRSVGGQIVLANTYHMYLRPGHEIIRQHGGLQQFTAWPGPMLTDSGGFQVFSLGRGNGGKLAKITDDGVTFQSHIDGSTHQFTPERVMQIEQALGADIIMPLDDVPAADSSVDILRETTERTIHWLEIQAKIWRNQLDPAKQSLFGIVQGGLNDKLRKQSAQHAVSLDLPGYAIGGVANGGESKAEMWQMVETVAPLLPTDKPRYLMGIGEPLDLLEGISRGVDMLDCVLPTRLARHGAVWLFKSFEQSEQKAGEWLIKLVEDGGQGWHGSRVDIGKTALISQIGPLMPGCDCLCCTTFNMGSLAHFVRINEPLTLRLLSLHNLRILFQLEQAAKQAIRAGEFRKLLAAVRASWNSAVNGVS